MNKEECELCIKYKTMYCPNSSECYMTQDKPYYQNRIMLLEENKQLKEKVNQLETNRDEVIEILKLCNSQCSKEAISILERGKE